MYSIIITCRRNPEFLRNLLNNLESKMNPEIIVFNVDAEDDEIEKVCSSFSTKFQDICTIEADNTGCAECIDKGMLYAKYENVVYCQDDITPSPYCFDTLYRMYNVGDPKMAMLSPNIKERNNNITGEGCREVALKENYSGRVFACFIMDKKVYEMLGGLDTKFYPVYYEDRDFLYKMFLKGFMACVTFDIEVQHAAGSTVQKKGIPDFDNYLAKNREYYIKKWGGPPTEEKYTIPFNGEKQ